MNPIISICIPAFKRVEYLKRLLDSISVQSYRDFEVIVTDDSDDNSVADLVTWYEKGFPIIYKKNRLSLGTPENWNESIRHATGHWIKLMHDDDWFSDVNSLSEFEKAIKQNPSSRFLYSAYVNVFENNKQAPVFINSFRRRKLQQDPVTLFSSNVIGPPSVTIVKNDKEIWYDRKIKWVVDIDFYIRYLKSNPPVYIPKALINVGIHKEQVTHSSFGVAEIVIPENFYLLNKVGIQSLSEVLVYDAWWRIIRNLKITSISKVRENGYQGEVHKVIQSMIRFQSKIPFAILKMGVFSKLFMFIHYLLNRKFLEQ
jgi:glycosyltransferase involved in cell wall biosynthesis